MGLCGISTRKFMSSQQSAGAEDWELVTQSISHQFTWSLLGGIATTKPEFKSKALQIFDEIRPKLLARPFVHQWENKTYCATTSITEYVSGIKNNNQNPTTKIPIQFSPGSTTPSASWEVLINTLEQSPQRLVKLLTSILPQLRVLRPIQTVS